MASDDGSRLAVAVASLRNSRADQVRRLVRVGSRRKAVKVRSQKTPGRQCRIWYIIQKTPGGTRRMQSCRTTFGALIERERETECACRRICVCVYICT